MLKTARVFEKTFDKFDEHHSKSNLKDDVSDYFDWISANKMVELL